MKNLISIEQKQKLDLLTHLVTNLQSSVILQGPKGAGKSTLLKAAADKGLDNSDIFLLNAELSLSFESIQYELLQFLNDKYQLDSRAITDVLLDYEKHEKKLVLIIDDANLLLTGLINALINYAKEYSALKLVFSLTPEEVVAKSKAEGIEHSCHFVDLVGLSFAESSVFIRQLIAAGNTKYTERDINNSLLQAIYKHSAGNLGKISSLLKGEQKKYITTANILIILAVVIAIASTVLSLFLWRDSSSNKVIPKPLLESKKKLAVDIMPKKHKEKANVEKVSAAKKFTVKSFSHEISPVVNIPTKPVIEVPIVNSPKTEVPIVPTPELSVANNLEKQEEAATSRVAKKQVAVKIRDKQEKKRDLQVSAELPLAKDIDDRAWVLRQKKTAYSMQLMALSSKKSLLDAQKAFKNLGYNTYYLQHSQNKKHKYTLYYGVFESIEEANNKVIELPAAMKKAWVRRFSAIRQNFSIE